MQCFNYWPELSKMALPELVAQDFYQHLLMPFSSKATAKEFWDDAPSSIIILNDFDCLDHLRGCVIWSQIEFVLSYPEYSEPLKLDYQVLLAIVNDSGSGIYLVVPPDISITDLTK